jgi:hypothetical protein
MKRLSVHAMGERLIIHAPKPAFPDATSVAPLPARPATRGRQDGASVAIAAFWASGSQHRAELAGALDDERVAHELMVGARSLTPGKAEAPARSV